MDKRFPGNPHSIPLPAQIDIQKLGHGGVITTDTCNQAQKVRRILCEIVVGALDYDCMNHLRNVWFGSMEKTLTKELNLYLRTSLDEIDPKLRVSTSMSALIRAVDKEFSLSANYPKGHGKLFLEWIRENYPGVLLLHVERAAGSRQDLCTEGSMAVYMNYQYYTEFLDMMLRKTRRSNSNEMASILQQNLFVALTSTEMIALSRLLSIFHISVCMPFRWLAGKTHELRDFGSDVGWGAMSMSRVIDTLYDKMNKLYTTPSLIVDDEFMMGIFNEYVEELPPFQDYWNLTFKKKQMSVVARSRKDGTKVVHMAMLRNELFSPLTPTNIKTTDMIVTLAEAAAKTICDELMNESKATYKYTNQSRSEYSYNHCGDEKKRAMLGMRATNDEAESALGGATAQVQQYGRINISSAAAVSDINRNKYLQRHYALARKKESATSQGLFHGFPDDVRQAIVSVAMEDAPSTRKQNTAAIQAQDTARREKEEMFKERNLENATEEFIEALYYHQMYFSPACWKDDPRCVARELRKLSSESAKYHALKENIMIRVKGFSWEWCRHQWSKDGHKYTVDQLAAHLRHIIKEEKNHEIPREPMPNVPKRVNLPTLGTQTECATELDQKYIANDEKFKINARKIQKSRQTKGEGSIYASMQPFARPALCDLLNERIDYLAGFQIAGQKEPELRWCQGEVVLVLADRNKPTVRVLWDAIPDCTGWETSQEAEVILLPTKWNKDKEGAWRMDIPIDIDGSDDEYDDKNNESDCHAEEFSDSESESSMSVGSD